MTKVSRSPNETGESPSHNWHLAEDDIGVAMTDLEYAVMRTYESFTRWQSECFAGVCEHQIAGQENALLHIIGMHGRPKTIRELMHLSNRQDIGNIQYSLRKLTKLGLIEKSGSGRVGVYYVCSARGAQICRDYAELRRKLLLKAVGELAGFVAHAEAAAKYLEQIEGIYEKAAREAATFYRR